LKRRCAASGSRGCNDRAANLGVIGRGHGGPGGLKWCDGLNWHWNNPLEHPPLRLDPVSVGSRIFFPGLVPGLGFQEGNALARLPERIVHDGVAGHAGNALQHERDIALDVVVAGPDRNRVGKPFVAVIRRGSPQIELCADALNVGREHGDIVALPLAVVERDGVRRSAPFDGKLVAPHCAGVFVSDGCWFGHDRASP
jgi:hypothetical protein